MSLIPVFFFFSIDKRLLTIGHISKNKFMIGDHCKIITHKAPCLRFIHHFYPLFLQMPGFLIFVRYEKLMGVHVVQVKRKLYIRK